MTYQPRDEYNTTLAIALGLGVTHEEILEAIEYLCGNHFANIKAEHFAEFEHTDPHGNRQRAYRMDRGGLVLLAHAYMGENMGAKFTPVAWATAPAPISAPINPTAAAARTAAAPPGGTLADAPVTLMVGYVNADGAVHLRHSTADC